MFDDRRLLTVLGAMRGHIIYAVTTYYHTPYTVYRYLPTVCIVVLFGFNDRRASEILTIRRDVLSPRAAAAKYDTDKYGGDRVGPRGFVLLAVRLPNRPRAKAGRVQVFFFL